ncbi:hypothetical protein Droror1_Dr00007161 [Drosera rotundifolia]
MGRSPCCAKLGLNRGAWTALEDHLLTDYINTHGEGNWRNLPKRAGLKRCGKSCRLRWLNYLRPDIKRGNITRDEEDLIVRLHKLLGNRWSLIAGRLPGRTDNEIKNYWNTNLSKKVQLDRHHHHHHCFRASSSSHRKSKKSRKSMPPSSSGNYDVPPFPEPKAVRTKAVRCTRVFIDDPNAHDQVNQSNPTSDNIAGIPPELPPAAGAGETDFLGGDMVMECGFVDAVNGSAEDRGPMLDFGLMDDCGGYLDLCGLQGSEFSNIDNFEFGYDDKVSNSGSVATGSSPEQPLLFSDEMLEHWAATNSVTAGDDYWMSSLM